jgi:hypothetical protein
MTPRMRRAAALAAAASVAAGAAAVPAVAADHTQELSIGAELIRQPKGKPWEVNLLLGAHFGTTDGSVPEPVQSMKLSFTSGAKVHSDAFKTCSENTLRTKGPSSCPGNSVLGTGTAVADVLGLTFDADVKVINGPGTASKRILWVWAKVRDIPTAVFVFKGSLSKTSGKYGWVVDLPLGRITIIGDNDASITAFDVKVGGYGRKKGKKVPFIEAPTKCTKPGWPFAGDFSYAGGLTGRATALIDCTIRAIPGKG